jgi:D-aspartate ligase
VRTESAARSLSAPPAIILGGSSNAVSVARSLGRAGVVVHALGDPRNQVRWSRHLDEFVPMRGSEVQIRTLEWLAAGPREGVILPCDDEGLELVAGHRAELIGLGYIPSEHDDKALLGMLDKERTYELARAAGVPTPFTMTVRGDAGLESIPHGFSFPCAVKPLQSHVFARHLPGVKGAHRRRRAGAWPSRAAGRVAGRRCHAHRDHPGARERVLLLLLLPRRTR